MEIKQKYPIDFAKGITWLIIIGLIYYFNQSNNLTAWIYFCLHGSYGIMWVMKSNMFPDKTWERKAGIPYTLLIIFGLIFLLEVSIHSLIPLNILIRIKCISLFLNIILHFYWRSAYRVVLSS